jgi:hypothetical protein
VEVSSKSLGTEHPLNFNPFLTNTNHTKNNYFIHFSPREGTGIAKFKRGRWSASDESPPKKQKSSHTDSGTAHSKFHLKIL